ncbi:MAG: hypothetical protein WBC87_05995, partial [Pseudolabrys sp.]
IFKRAHSPNHSHNGTSCLITTIYPSLFSPAGADKLNSEMGAVFDRLQNANEKRSHEEAVLKPVEETGLKGATDGFRKREYEGAANTLPSHASGSCNPAH